MKAPCFSLAISAATTQAAPITVLSPTSSSTTAVPTMLITTGPPCRSAPCGVSQLGMTESEQPIGRAGTTGIATSANGVDRQPEQHQLLINNYFYARGATCPSGNCDPDAYNPLS